MSQLARVRCTLCGEWIVSTSINSADLANGYQCPSCRDDAIASAEALDALDEPLALACTPEPEPGRTYCALAWLTWREHSLTQMVPAGIAVLCDPCTAALHAQFTAKYAGVLPNNIIAGVTLMTAERYVKAARAQAVRVYARYPH